MYAFKEKGIRKLPANPTLSFKLKLQVTCELIRQKDLLTL